MRMKPEACSACPLYESSVEFVADYLPPAPVVMMVRDTPGAGDIEHGVLGESREAWGLRRYNIELAGFAAEDVAMMCVLRCKPTVMPRGNVLKRAINTCRQYDHIDESTVKACVAVGKLSWRILSNNAGGRIDWRGYYVQREFEEDHLGVDITKIDTDSADKVISAAAFAVPDDKDYERDY